MCLRQQCTSTGSSHKNGNDDGEDCTNKSKGQEGCSLVENQSRQIVCNGTPRLNHRHHHTPRSYLSFTSCRHPWGSTENVQLVSFWSPCPTLFSFFFALCQLGEPKQHPGPFFLSHSSQEMHNWKEDTDQWVSFASLLFPYPHFLSPHRKPSAHLHVCTQKKPHSCTWVMRWRSR